MRTRFAVVAALAAMPLATAVAQDAQLKTPRNALTFQPLTAMLTIYSAEYERAASKSVTWGIGATYWDAGDDFDKVKYNSGDFKLRYYPNGTALTGFSFGGSVGFSRVSQNNAGADPSTTGVSFGVLLEYQWLLGTKKNFVTTLGAGAKALTVNEDEFSGDNVTARYPTARISVGYAW